MKMFKVCIDWETGTPMKPLGDANGENIPNAKFYFDRMGKGEIILDAPVFDSFFLQSFGKKEDWEWELQDVHGFTYQGSQITGWYISDRFKKVMEKLSISERYHFYPTKLLYKGKKLDYWIFQYHVDIDNLYVFEKCEFDYAGSIEHISSHEEFYELKSRARKEKKLKELHLKVFAITKKCDFIASVLCDDLFIVSEKFKDVFESNGFEGLTFKPVEYEVRVDKSHLGVE